MNPSTSEKLKPPANQFKGKDSKDSLQDKNAAPKDKEPEVEKAPDIMWLNYETRLRKLMHELLLPTVKRSREDRELYDLLKHKNEALTKRVEELETITHKSDAKQTIFDDIFNRINKLDTLRKSENIEITERIKKLEEETSAVAYDYNHLRDSLKTVHDLTQMLSEDFTKTTMQLDEYKKSFSTLASDLQKNVNDEANRRKEDNIKIEEKFQATNNNILDLRNNMSAHEIVMQNTRTTLNDLITKVTGFEKEVLECNNSIVSFSKYIDSIKSLKTKTEQFELRARTTENYLERYLPIFVQAQISETLHHCLPSNKRKLHYYEEKKFREMNNEVLHDDGNPDLQKRIQSMYSILEATVKRYSKSMAANALGIRSRESVLLKNTESSLSKFTSKAPRTGGAATLSDRMKNMASDGEKSDVTGRLGAGPSSMDDKIDEIEVQTSSRHASVVLEGDESTKRKDNDFDKDKASSIARLSARIDEKDDKVILENEALEQAGDEVSDGGSDLDHVQTKQIKNLQEDIAAIKAHHESTFRKLYQEMNERLGRISQEQLESAENATVNARNAMSDVEKFIREKQKAELEKNMELDGLVENIKRSNDLYDKSYQYLRRLSDIVVPLIETVNGLLSLSLKEEKEKKTLINMLQMIPQSTVKGAEDTFKRRKEGDGQKKLLDLPFLAGSKVGGPTEERDETIDFEIKLSYNGKAVRAIEFLELTFENFRNCLAFSTKFRVASNFAQFFEGETYKVPNGPRKSLRSAKGGPHLLYDEKGSERVVSAGIKAPFSRVGALSYKNYVSENANARILDKRKSPAGLINDRGELNVNKSFH